VWEGTAHIRKKALPSGAVQGRKGHSTLFP
jgi:hypothetical protein